MSDIVATTLQRVSSVATLPAIALQIIKLADDPTSTADDMQDVLGRDPALAARVLKVVNSAFYGRPRQVSTTYAAIQLLGLSAIRNIAVAASLTRIFRGGRAIVGFDPPALWVHSVAVGAASRRLAIATELVAPDEALLAGLLHDIGVMISIQAWLPEFTAVVEALRASASLDFRDVERRIIGADHEQFGEALCEQWHFPRAFGLVCGHHHEPMSLPIEDQVLPAIVHVADILAARAAVGFSRTVTKRDVSSEVLLRIGLRGENLVRIEQSLSEELAAAMALFAA